MSYVCDDYTIFVTQRLMSGMVDFGVNGLGIELDDFYGQFLDSRYASKIENGDSRTVMGMSGIEVAYEVTGRDYLSESEMNRFIDFNMNRSAEFWTGWALSYLQCTTGLTYGEINDFRSASEVRRMYPKYHEMDITQFVDSMKAAYRKANPITRLQAMRKQLGLSQKMLADMSGIPVKTIQQYEQRRKDINRASVDYMVSLSNAMHCDIKMLLEKI